MTTRVDGLSQAEVSDRPQKDQVNRTAEHFKQDHRQDSIRCLPPQYVEK